MTKLNGAQHQLGVDPLLQPKHPRQLTRDDQPTKPRKRRIPLADHDPSAPPATITSVTLKVTAHSFAGRL